MSNPIFSIIIPTFNSEKTLKVCIDSILTQTFLDIEILLIDGLSTDATLNLIKCYEDERVKFISKKDKGIYDAMNKGIVMSKGEWLLFLGSDDSLYDCNVLKDVYNYTSTSTYDLIYGKVLFTNSNKNYGEFFDLEKLLFEKNLCHQSVFYKKKNFDLNGLYSLKYPLWADWEFNIRCFRNTRIHTHYYDRMVANYNDGMGQSGQKEDDVLKKELPMFYKVKIWELESELSILRSRLTYKIDFHMRQYLNIFNRK